MRIKVSACRPYASDGSYGTDQFAVVRSQYPQQSDCQYDSHLQSDFNTITFSYFHNESSAPVGKIASLRNVLGITDDGPSRAVHCGLVDALV
ncbi:Hypothetical protein CINCED_3A015889 [Cinara cedri]|uniref:Uncharacterized protein n=1 Tax=Cinara cedri TaxID=506608 RepID=A0A5E4NLM0_9HEMI|nr:Hypothetical protein CINCED_3A015889 [Cinara cedri]